MVQIILDEGDHEAGVKRLAPQSRGKHVPGQKDLSMGISLTRDVWSAMFRAEKPFGLHSKLSLGEFSK